MPVPFVQVALPSALLGILAYIYIRFQTRISPDVPYAGEESLLSRLKVPVEYGLDPVRFLVQQRKKLGDVFCVDLFVRKFVYCIGGGANREILRASEEEISFTEGVQQLAGPIIPLKLFKHFDDINRVLRLGFINNERLKGYKEECLDIAQEQFNAWSSEASIPLFKSFSELISTYFVTVMFGRSFCRLHGTKIIQLTDELFSAMTNPLLQILPGFLFSISPPGQRAREVQRQFDEILKPEIQRIYERKRQGLPLDDNTYLSFICSQLDQKLDFVMLYHLPSMMFAAQANLGGTIAWMFLHARKTNAWERCKDELENGSRTYLDACLRETGRLYTTSSIIRIVPSKHPKGYVNILGRRIPRGTLVACSPAASHRDPSVFENPENWIPERFLANEGEAYAKWFQRLDFTQFGAGGHPCIGEKLSRVLFYDLILETWMKNFDIQIVSGLCEGEGIDGVGIDVDWMSLPSGTPPGKGRDVMVKVVKLT